MQRLRFLFAAALMLVSAFVDLPAAIAQPTGNEARDLFRRGQRSYQQGDYESAIRDWRSAFELDPRPLILFNLSQAHERLGQPVEAAQALERYLEGSDPDDPHQSDARARLAALRERLGRTGIRIVGAPDGSAITVDDREWGVTPRPDPIPVEPGAHRVSLQNEGFEGFEASVFVPAGQVLEVEGAMEASPTRTHPSKSDRAEGRPSRLGPILLMGIGGAAVVGGAITGVLALGAAGDASTDTDASQARALGIVTDALLWPGLALAAGGAIWWFLQGRGAEHPSASSATLEVHPMLGPNLAGARARLRF